MKRFLKPLIVVLLLISAIAATVLFLAEKPHPKVVVTANTEKKPIEIFPHAYQCSRCKMDIVDKIYSAQVVDSKGKTWFFDDIGCMILWLAEAPLDKKGSVIWVYALDTQKPVDAKKAFFSQNESTPMHYGFGAYENQKEGTISFKALLNRMKSAIQASGDSKYVKHLSDSK